MEPVRAFLPPHVDRSPPRPGPPAPGFEIADEAETCSPDAVLEIGAGLQARHARVSPKYFYDRLGSRLFEAITDLAEYYPTRAERALLEAHAASIAGAAGRGTTIIDLGAGNCEKAMSLFPALAPRQYAALDVSVEFVRDAVEALARRWPEVEALAVPADLGTEFSLPREVRAGQRLFTFFGSSIGNFDPAEADLLLRRLRAHCREGGGLLIGIDLVKPREVLDAAYNDALGVTAAFNLNILRNVNALIGADFEVRDWRHRAFFDPVASRIEMHLEARRDLVVCWSGGRRSFARGERIHTENSYKYRVPEFRSRLFAAGFRESVAWADESERFALVYARA